MSAPVSPQEDVTAAAVEVIARAGANEVEFGYLDDDVPSSQARWWARAQWKGTRVQVEGRASPQEALESLVVKLLHGGQCVACGGTIAITEGRWTKGRTCRWRREGAHWVRGCVSGSLVIVNLHSAVGSHEPLGALNRAQRRRQDKVKGLRR